mmetsp:Transcript_24898/g.27708  ORF Transcript_24898/g.27708 Transcript_24898/m.27708 type:complete len:98 (-) Transcript_24898:166-459(-)
MMKRRHFALLQVSTWTVFFLLAIVFVHCSLKGVCLVPIPYWWKEEDLDSIIATILYYKPELAYELPRVKAKPLLADSLTQDINLENSVMSPRAAMAL